MNMKSLGVAALVLAVSAGSASAVPYSFAGGNPNPGLFDTDCEFSGFLNTGCTVTFGPNGAGVDGFGFDSVPDWQPGSIDSFPLSSETLIVNFLSPFILTAFELGGYSGFDDFEYSLDGGSFIGLGLSNPMLFGLGISVSSLAIRASTDNFRDLFSPDAFTLSSISGIAAVPVPAGIALGASALAGLGLMSWRKRTKIRAAA
jgi:hypothetical protein